MGIVTIVTALLIFILVVCCFAYVRRKQLGAKTTLQSLPTRKASPSKSAKSRFSHQVKNQTTQSASRDSELEARLFRKLLTKCMGDEAKAKRLIDQARAPLGVETQRQGSDQGIVRTPPTGLGLFSLVTLLAHSLQSQPPLSRSPTTWYPKARPTLMDALATVRHALWSARLFQRSVEHPTLQEVPSELLEIWSDLLGYAA